MVFAAQKLRRDSALKSPTVMVLVDRTDLDTQITGIFDAADVSNVVVNGEKSKRCERLLERNDTREDHRLDDSQVPRDAPANLNDPGEHRGAGRRGPPDAGGRPRACHARGLAQRVPLWSYGDAHQQGGQEHVLGLRFEEEDEGGYMSRYTFHDSIRDEATLPLHFRAAPGGRPPGQGGHRRRPCRRFKESAGLDR